ncbi:MAG: AbrB/MazE/SpoVT family DNA-binding domain-containing protein [Luteolibacter sp.]|uniref:AbrB/MazE/SpoVT family DNA-binding domain-containing protein n=1 Tax=Luteolibacter sp. TaxID=1962973 RepID=UPI003262CF23
MPQLKLTSKRQVTFPKEACDALHVGPGDIINLETAMVDGRKVYILRAKQFESPWFGMLRDKAAKVDDHSMEAVRSSIAKGRKRTGE